MVTAIIIAAVAGFISLVSAGTSIGTILHFKKKFASMNQDDTKVDVLDEKIEERFIVPNDGSSFAINTNDTEMMEIETFSPRKIPSEPQFKGDKLAKPNSTSYPAIKDTVNTPLHGEVLVKPKDHHPTSSLVSRTTEKREVHIQTREKHDIFSSETSTETGRPNKVPENLSLVPGSLLKGLTPQSALEPIIGGFNGITDMLQPSEKPKETNSGNKLQVAKTHTRHSSIDLPSPREEGKFKMLPKTPEPIRLTSIKENEELRKPAEKKISFAQQLNEHAKAKIGEFQKEALSTFSKTVNDDKRDHKITPITAPYEESDLEVLGLSSSSLSSSAEE